MVELDLGTSIVGSIIPSLLLLVEENLRGVRAHTVWMLSLCHPKVDSWSLLTNPQLNLGRPKPGAGLLQASLRLCPVPPAVWAEAHQGGMVQLHIGSHAAVFPLKEIFGAPDSDSAVIRTGGQILAITTEVHARYIPTMALGKRI